MQDKGIADVGMDQDACESVVLQLLLDEDHPLWTVEEIARELGHDLNAVDACNRLYAGGLLHRCGDFVLATRAAARAHELPG